MADVKGRAGASLKRRHEPNQEESDEEPTVFPCELCTATFVTQISLTRHMILHEDDQEDRNRNVEPCESEKAESLQANNQESEPTTSKPDESTPAKVPKLQKTLKPLPNLKPLPPLIPKREFELAQAQMKTHPAFDNSSIIDRSKTHRCDTCSVYFGKKEDLARHITRTHGGARFTCPYCSRNISRRDHLKRHIKNVHPEICTDTEIGPFLADPNASRAAKEQHAENFVAQYGSPVKPQLSVMSPSVSQNTSPQQQYNDDDLYEEGDEEFEGEEDEAEVSADGMQQITIEPELPLSDDYEDEQKYDEDSTNFQMPEDLFDMQQLIVQNPTISTNNNSPGNQVIQPTPERKFKCEMCDAAFMSKINLQRHLSTHSIIRPHKCSLCGKGFLRKEHLTKHLSSVHSGMKFTCQFCGKDISRKDHLLRHIRNCHPVEYMGMPAEFIQSEMSQPIPRHAEKSILGMQLTQKQSYIVCDICPESFNHIDELHEHQSSMHSDVRKYKCPNCPKAFKRKEHLVKHEVLHSGEKKFGCSICRKVFPRKDAVHDHIRRVHRQEAPLPSFPCNLCDNVFLQQAHLRQHLKTYHGVSNSDEDFHNAGGFNLNGTTQNDANYTLANSKRDSSAPTKFSSNRSSSSRINKGLGSLMGLINKGSLSLSRVASTGHD